MVSKIIVGVDSSHTALRAAETAAKLATGLGSEMHILCAFNVDLTTTLQAVTRANDPNDMSTAFKQLVSEAEKEAERTASAVTEHLRNKFPDVIITSRAAPGTPGTALIDAADQIGADLIVVGNRRVQGPQKILGSIARTIAGGTNCDLYLVNTHPR